jgi:hypothetical protein
VGLADGILKEFKVGFDFPSQEKQEVIVIPPFVKSAKEERVDLRGKQRGKIVVIDKKGQGVLAKKLFHDSSFRWILVHLEF